MNKYSIASLFYRLLSALVLLALIMGAGPYQLARAATVRYVKPSGLTSGECDSWENACDLQYALGLAILGDEVWVKQGIYKPTNDNDRTVAIQLKNGVGLYGGFNGTETVREQRNWDINITTLSGDIGVEGDNSDNSYHVVTCRGTDTTTVLDGFTVMGGNAHNLGSEYEFGGGIYIYYSNPSLTAVIFESNSAYGGGAMYNDNSHPSLADVSFIGNSATDYGGGMYNYYSNPSLKDVTFTVNSADILGGGIYGLNSNSSLTDVSFSANSAGEYGGGMFNNISSPSLTNVTFTGNATVNNGGGMYNYFSNPNLMEVTFDSNSAMNFGGGMYNLGSTANLANVIFIANTAAYGGGIFNDKSNPNLKKITFTSNAATYLGGGVFNSESSPNLVNVIFTGNIAAYGGGIFNGYQNPNLKEDTFKSDPAFDHNGGIHQLGSNPNLANVIFNSNFASINGGGVYNSESSPILANVTFYGNSAVNLGGGIYNSLSNPSIYNSIMWDNSPEQVINDATSNPIITYSILHGGCPEGSTCTRVIDADPLFVNPVAGDLHLGETSLAIDAGDNSRVPADTLDLDHDGNTSEPLPYDLAGKSRFVDVPAILDTGVGEPPIVDMGAYEAQFLSMFYLPIINK